MSQPMSLPTVAVSANVQRAVAPDSYVVIARAVARAADSSTAAAQLAARFSELEAVVGGLTHLALELERGGVSVHPDWEAQPFGDKAPSGWQASRQLSATGRNLGQVAELVGALGRVADLQTEGPHWQLDRDNPVHSELAAEAVHEAIARAGRYAAALGATLGRLVELTDTGMAHGGREMMFAASARAVDMSPGLETLDFTPQPIEVYAGVQGRWYLTLPD
ncbi:MAG: SIMPL domain-containing protein [Pseudonocardiales bacterium]